MRARHVSVGAGVLVLAACARAPSVSPDPPAAAGPPAIAAIALAQVAGDGVVEAGTTRLVVSPGQVFRCGERDRVAVTVSWTTRELEIGEGVEIRVSGPAEAMEKTFAKGGHEGSAETGEWVRAGTRFMLLGTGNDKVLASYEVGGLACG